MLWKTSPRRPRVGYTIQATNGGKEKFELILNGNDSLSAYKFDEVIGNTNAKGRWSWKLSGNFSGNVNKSGMDCFFSKALPALDFLALIQNISCLTKVSVPSINDRMLFNSLLFICKHFIRWKPCPRALAKHALQKQVDLEVCCVCISY